MNKFFEIEVGQIWQLKETALTFEVTKIFFRPVEDSNIHQVWIELNYHDGPYSWEGRTWEYMPVEFRKNFELPSPLSSAIFVEI